MSHSQPRPQDDPLPAHFVQIVWTICAMIGIACFATVAFASKPDAIETVDSGPAVCVCDIQGRTICHFPDVNIAQVLPRDMCAKKQAGDNPLVSDRQQ